MNNRKQAAARKANKAYRAAAAEAMKAYKESGASADYKAKDAAARQAFQTWAHLNFECGHYVADAWIYVSPHERNEDGSGHYGDCYV